nr:uncharacterized protein [uncultured bacterium]
MMSQFAREVLSINRPEWVTEMVRQDGRLEGEAKMLTRQLQHRFGSLPDWVREKIAQANSDTLEAWSLRFIDARSLEEIFAD